MSDVKPKRKLYLCYIARKFEYGKGVIDTVPGVWVFGDGEPRWVDCTKANAETQVRHECPDADIIWREDRL